MKVLIGVYRGLVCYLGMTLNGLVNISLYLISLGTLRRFNAEVVSPFFCKAILVLIGIKVKLPDLSQYPNRKVIYMFNHNSFLDIFIAPTLRLPKTRFILSTRTKKILPLFLSNLGLGTFFIPFKDKPQKRVQFLTKLAHRLEHENDNIICAPEGVHTFRHYIGKFNKAIFHAAVVSKTPICPLFFKIPERCNPLESYFFQGGHVSVEVMPLIETADWKIEELEENIQNVRQIFVSKFNQEFLASIV